MPADLPDAAPIALDELERAAQGALVESPLLTLRTALAALEADR